jgi:predicted ArsR family transcriptional regulator
MIIDVDQPNPRRHMMAKDATGREGMSAGGIAKELDTTPAAVKKTLAKLEIDADFVKAGCAYYYTDRIPKVRQALG